MPINKNNPDYNGDVQELIWNIATNLMPLEITLPMVPQELQEPCNDLYNFMSDLLNDMYQDTKKYDLIDKSVVWFYIRAFFEWMHKKFQFSDNAFVTSKDEYKKYVIKMNPRNVEIMLSNHGFELIIEEENIRIVNRRYPEMLRAVSEILKASYKNYSVNCTDYLTTCDFRALVNYKRTYDDMLFALNNEDKIIAEQLRGFAAGIGVKPIKCTYFYRVEFKKKGKMVFILDVTGQKNLKINIGFAEIGSEAFKAIEKEIETYDDANELTTFWRKNLKKCVNCRAECWKRDNPITVFGKKTLVCQAYIRTYKPKEQDLKYLYRLINLRTMVVDSGISEPFYPGNG